MSEGGEARNHEAEVEAVARLANPAFDAATHDETREKWKRDAARYIRALDAVRCFSQDIRGCARENCFVPDTACVMGFAAGFCPYRSPKGEDHEAVEDEIDYEMGARVLAAAEPIDDEVEPPAPVSGTEPKAEVCGEYRKPDGYCPACGGENDHHPTCDLGRYYRALAKLDGKVHPGWRQAVITQALRPSPEFMKRSQQIIEEGQKMLDDDWDGMAGR